MPGTMTQKLINDGDAAVDEMLEGVMAAHGDLLTRSDSAPRRSSRATGRVRARWR